MFFLDNIFTPQSLTLHSRKDGKEYESALLRTSLIETTTSVITVDPLFTGLDPSHYKTPGFARAIVHNLRASEELAEGIEVELFSLLPC